MTPTKKQLRKEREKAQAKTSLVSMDRALHDIWAYIVAPENKLSNQDADRILALVKEGLGSTRMGKGW